MTKTRCKKEDYQPKENPKYVCERCGRNANKKEKVCKPKKVHKAD
ncbi:MAG: hypothetical protein Q8862_12245 [Bacteroidota bacterium]|nr:hypothetical protein [Bacteroidota bacterium]MDP4204993.1 hypothetical protein [Bacteroidota bacterium]